MGRPKLTLPIAGRPLIARVVTALRAGGVSRVLVVAPPEEVAGADRLRHEAGTAGAEVIVAPSPTADMRATIEIGLRALDASETAPEWLALCPADSPGLSASLVAALLAQARTEPGAIFVPAYSGRRGHPLLLPWPLALTIPNLPSNVGVNALLARHADLARLVPLDDPGSVTDLDTPEDYERWAGSRVEGCG